MIDMLVSKRSFYSPYSTFYPTESTKLRKTSVGSMYFREDKHILAKVYLRV